MFWHNGKFPYHEMIKRLMRSDHELLKDHYFFGICMWTGKPVLVPRKMINEHVWTTGGSASGKTATILAPLLEQFAARRNMSIVYIDLKGDQAAFCNLFDAAYRVKVPFKYFSPVVGEESFLYNPLRQKVHQRMTIAQRAEWFSQAGGIDYGNVYGSSFFQGENELVLCNYLAHYRDPVLEDFGELYRLFNDPHAYTGHAEDYRNASQLRSLFGRLACLSSLNATPRNLDKPLAHSAAMEMSDLLREPGIYYFKLPASIGRNASRFAARSVAQNLFASAGLRDPGENLPVCLVLDEFQELVGPSIDVFLEQCRSRGITVILAHQSIQQLERNGVNLLPVVQSCTSTHIVVEASDAESIEYVQKRSGQAYFGLTSWSQEAPANETEAYYGSDFFAPWRAATSDGLGTPLVSVQEELRYRADENLIRRVSADALAAFIVLKKNSGLVNYDGVMFPVRCFYHIDEALFKIREIEPWPKWNRPETVIVQDVNPFAPGAKDGLPEPVQIVPPPVSANGPLLDRLRNRPKKQN